MSIVTILGSNEPHTIKMQALKDALTQSTVLDLHKEILNDSELSDLARALKSNTTLTHLDLSWVKLNKFEADTIQALAEALENHPSIVYLNLSFTHEPGSSSAYLPILCNAIQNNRKITHILANHLYLRHPSDKEAIQALFSLVEHNTAIKYLNLKITFDDNSLHGFKLALEKNRSLQTLELAFMYLEGENFNLIGEALKTNKTLQHLTVGCSLYESEIDCFFDEIQTNECLTFVKLNSRNISPGANIEKKLIHWAASNLFKKRRAACLEELTQTNLFPSVLIPFIAEYDVLDETDKEALAYYEPATFPLLKRDNLEVPVSLSKIASLDNTPLLTARRQEKVSYLRSFILSLKNRWQGFVTFVKGFSRKQEETSPSISTTQIPQLTIAELLDNRLCNKPGALLFYKLKPKFTTKPSSASKASRTSFVNA